MLKDTSFKFIYSTGGNEPIEFFLNALLESNQFDLGLGYFSTSGINVLALGFASFISKGGTMRVIINSFLSEKDKEAILRGETSDIENLLEESILCDLKRMYNILSQNNELFFNCISFLISRNRIQFKAVVPIKNTSGIAHHKFGIFYDQEGNKVAFSGSANFSANALIKNVESIDCYTSWNTEYSESQRLDHFCDLFNNTWTNKFDHLFEIPIQRVKAYIVEQYSKHELDNLIKRERKILEGLYSSKSISKESLIKYQNIMGEPQFPFPNGPYPYQDLAYEKWRKNEYKGIFAMATGTGKTITSLNCVLNLYKLTNKYKILILVPTVALLNQWTKEVNKFNYRNIITTSFKEWYKFIDNILFNEKSFNICENFILISTYCTFNKSKFQLLMKKYSWSDVILIADEVHNLGSPSLLKKLPQKITFRIGLSATPNRIYDDIGSEEIYYFFNSFPDCFTYNYSMKKAIKDEILAKYDYFPYTVNLNYDELKEYRRISEKLIKFYDRDSNSYKEEANFLLIQRKRIIHKAANKIVVLKKILKDIEDLRYTFIYVPEGDDIRNSEKDDSSSIDINEADNKIIDFYLDAIHNAGYKVRKMIHSTIDRDQILSQFEKGDIDILISMRILDEGVDIPITRNAIFCASTGNPRQFIQRRGRVLRRYKDKTLARVFDLIVTPNLEDFETDSSLSNMEINIFRAELRRVANFIYCCENQNDILRGEIGDLARKFDIDLFKMINEFNFIDQKCN